MRLLYFDTESTDLSASWGRILMASFAVGEGDVYTFRGDKRPHDKPSNGRTVYLPGDETVDDSRLCEAIRDELETADIIIGWNSILHDIPLLNARLQAGGKRPYKNKTWPSGSHIDAMYYATGGALKVGGKSLDRIATFFQSPNQKTKLDGKVWQRAAAGDRSAMDTIQEHCEADVLTMRDVFPSLAPHIKKLVLPFSYWYKFADQIEL